MTKDVVVYCTSLAVGFLAAWLLCRLRPSAAAALALACVPIVGMVCLLTFTGDG
ncbi:MAG: hypothetical protein WD070_12620 [Pirellulaceae bacterium]